MQISKKLRVALAVAFMGTSFGAISQTPAEAAYVRGADGLWYETGVPTNTNKTDTTKTPTSGTGTKKAETPKPSNGGTTTKPTTGGTTTKPANGGTTTKPTTPKPAVADSKVATKKDEGVLTKVAVKEPTNVTAVTINARDKKYLVNAAKFPIGKIGTTKTFNNKVSAGSITYYKDAIRITETVSKNAPPKALTYINMGGVQLTQANIKGVSTGKEISKRLDDNYNQKEKDYKLAQHGVLHVYSNDKNRATIVLEIPNDTYVQEKIKANDKLRTDLKNLDKKRNTAITTAATALSQTNSLKADVNKLMTNSYYTEWKTTESLRSEKEGIEANQEYLKSQMTSLDSQLKTLKTKKTTADTKVKTLTTQKATADTKVKTLTSQKNTANTKVKNLTAQKTKAKTTAEKNKIQTQITAAQKSLNTTTSQLTAAQKTQKGLASQLTTAQNTQKSLATQISSVNTKKADLQKKIDTVNNRYKTVVTQWQTSWNKVNGVNTKVEGLKKSYDTARTQYLNAKKTIETSADQIKKLNSNAVIKSWKATSIPASTSF